MFNHVEPCQMQAGSHYSLQQSFRKVTSKFRQNECCNNLCHRYYWRKATKTTYLQNHQTSSNHPSWLSEPSGRWNSTPPIASFQKIKPFLVDWVDCICTGWFQAGQVIFKSAPFASFCIVSSLFHHLSSVRCQGMPRCQCKSSPLSLGNRWESRSLRKCHSMSSPDAAIGPSWLVWAVWQWKDRLQRDWKGPRKGSVKGLSKDCKNAFLSPNPKIEKQDKQIGFSKDICSGWPWQREKITETIYPYIYPVCCPACGAPKPFRAKHTRDQYFIISISDHHISNNIISSNSKHKTPPNQQSETFRYAPSQHLPTDERLRAINEGTSLKGLQVEAVGWVRNGENLKTTSTNQRTTNITITNNQPLLACHLSNWSSLVEISKEKECIVRTCMLEPNPQIWSTTIKDRFDPLTRLNASLLFRVNPNPQLYPATVIVHPCFGQHELTFVLFSSIFYFTCHACRYPKKLASLSRETSGFPMLVMDSSISSSNCGAAPVSPQQNASMKSRMIAQRLKIWQWLVDPLFWAQMAGTFAYIRYFVPICAFKDWKT